MRSEAAAAATSATVSITYHIGQLTVQWTAYLTRQVPARPWAGMLVPAPHLRYRHHGGSHRHRRHRDVPRRARSRSPRLANRSLKLVLLEREVCLHAFHLLLHLLPDLQLHRLCCFLRCSKLSLFSSVCTCRLCALSISKIIDVGQERVTKEGGLAFSMLSRRMVTSPALACFACKASLRMLCASERSL